MKSGLFFQIVSIFSQIREELFGNDQPRLAFPKYYGNGMVFQADGPVSLWEKKIPINQYQSISSKNVYA